MSKRNKKNTKGNPFGVKFFTPEEFGERCAINRKQNYVEKDKRHKLRKKAMDTAEKDSGVFNFI